MVDWRSSIIGELETFSESHGVQRDWPTFADNWRKGYLPAMDRVRRGELPWTRIDDLHRMILDDLLREAGITAISDADIGHLNRAWHRLDPWPDSVAGLTRLKIAVRHHDAVERKRLAADQHGQAGRTAVGLCDLGGVVPPLQA